MISRFSTPEGTWATDLWRLALVFGFLFAFMLGTRALGTPDEARYSEIPREMVATGHYITPRLNGVKYLEKPPFFYWLQSFSVRLFGLGEWSMRAWTAVFALLGVLGTYASGRILFDRRSGLIAAILLATSFLYYGMSRVVTLDMTVSVLIALTLQSFLVGLRFPLGRTRRMLLWSAYACAALAVLTKGLIGIVLPMLVIGVWIAWLNRWSLLTEIYLPSGLLIFFALSAPWHVLAQLHNPEFFHYYFVRQHFERYLTPVEHRPGPPWYFVTVLVAGFMPWTPFMLQAVLRLVRFRGPAREQTSVELFLFLWAALIFLFFSASDSKLIPYILPIFPAVALLVGRYLSLSWDHAPPLGVRAGYAVLAVVSCLLAIPIALVPRFVPTLEPDLLRVAMPVLAVLLAATGIAGLVTLIRQGQRRALYAVAVGFSLFLMTLNAAMPALDVRSIKPLALALKARLRPGDEVASYDTYYQDLPFYLRRIVTVVNWQGELAAGLRHENDRAWMISRHTFWTQWASAKTVCVMTSVEELKAFRARGVTMVPIAANAYNGVVCNHPLAP